MLAAPGGATCTPLVCAAPLALPTAAPRTACIGCSANLSGVYPACAVCAAGALCPGATSVPLVDFTAASAAAFTAACPPLTGPAALPAPRLSTATASGFEWLTGILTVDLAVLSGAAAAGLVVLLLSASRCLLVTPLPLARSLGGALDFAFSKVDAFAMIGPVGVGESPRRRPRAAGGAFALLGATAFLTVTTVLVLQRAANNVSVARSVDVLDAAQLAAASALPFAAAPPWGQGIQVRITASGEPGACAAPLAWGGAGLAAGAWALAPPRSAPCGAAPTSAQLVFSCAACTLTAASALEVTLHYSCQSLLIEAGALDANGTVVALALPPAETRGAPGALLATVTWTLQPLLSVLTSSVPAQASARGYTLSGSAHAVATAPLAAAADGAALVAPAAASVRVRVALPLQPFFQNVVLTEKVTVTALLTSIVGLAGIFSLFGTLLGVADEAAKLGGATTLKTGSRVASAAPPAGEKGDGEDERFTFDNPLAVARREGGGGACSVAAAPSDGTATPSTSTSIAECAAGAAQSAASGAAVADIVAVAVNHTLAKGNEALPTSALAAPAAVPAAPFAAAAAPPAAPIAEPAPAAPTAAAPAAAPGAVLNTAEIDDAVCLPSVVPAALSAAERALVDGSAAALAVGWVCIAAPEQHFENLATGETAWELPPEADCALAALLAEGGAGLAADDGAAAAAYARAAAAGNAPAMRELALCLELGMGVSIDERAAAGWRQRAAAANNAAGDFAAVSQ